MFVPGIMSYFVSYPHKPFLRYRKPKKVSAMNEMIEWYAAQELASYEPGQNVYIFGDGEPYDRNTGKSLSTTVQKHKTNVERIATLVEARLREPEFMDKGYFENHTPEMYKWR